jgi:hypothetical protein
MKVMKAMKKIGGSGASGLARERQRDAIERGF